MMYTVQDYLEATSLEQWVGDHKYDLRCRLDSSCGRDQKQLIDAANLVLDLTQDVTYSRRELTSAILRQCEIFWRG